jgi:hypothetical protein
MDFGEQQAWPRNTALAKLGLGVRPNPVPRAGIRVPHTHCRGTAVRDAEMVGRAMDEFRSHHRTQVEVLSSAGWDCRSCGVALLGARRYRELGQPPLDSGEGCRNR